ncbi:hypothetical protein STEG23_029311, partial [Scotinomys teguina]
ADKGLQTSLVSTFINVNPTAKYLIGKDLREERCVRDLRFEGTYDIVVGKAWCQQQEEDSGSPCPDSQKAKHTSILPFSLVEAILRPHRYPPKKLGLALLGTFNLAYIIRILWRYFQTGNWVYPVFASLSPLGIFIFLSAAYILNAGIYLLGEKISHWKWGKGKKKKVDRMEHLESELKETTIKSPVGVRKERMDKIIENQKTDSKK